MEKAVNLKLVPCIIQIEPQVLQYVFLRLEVPIETKFETSTYQTLCATNPSSLPTIMTFKRSHPTVGWVLNDRISIIVELVDACQSSNSRVHVTSNKILSPGDFCIDNLVYFETVIEA